MNFTSNFLIAFNHAMLYEVGPWWNPNDPVVISGKIGSSLLNRKCGYVDIDGDSGGCTKFGISQASNPNVDVKAINLYQAQKIYFEQYWIAYACDKITIPITVLFFDAVINNGGSRAVKFIQQAVGATPIDGNIGPVTLGILNKTNPEIVINAFSTIRENRYNLIVENDSSQGKFLAGWLRRNKEVTQYALLQLA